MNPAPSPTGIAPRVCLYRSVADASFASALDRLPAALTVAVIGPVAADEVPAGIAVLDCDRPTDPTACLCRVRELDREAAWILLDAAAELPAYWWPRLHAAIAEAPAAVISPMGSDRAALDACPPGLAAGDCDGLAWLYAEHRLWPCADWSRLLSYWPAQALAELDAEGGLPASTEALVCSALYVGGRGDAARAEPGHSLGRLTAHLQQVRRSPHPPIGLDGRPVLLHVLHGWGGGVERFVRDYSASDESYRHLILRADNDPERAQPGRSLSLHHDLDQPPLRHWPLNQPISATSLGHDEYRQVLQAIRTDFPLAGVLVSSLIGHSLDVLRTGLPTALVCHDYYPLWPLLHADFGAAGTDFSSSGIAAALARHGRAAAFNERRPAWWQALRKLWVETLRTQRVTLIAPSECVRRNICRIEPALTELRWSQIPHGLPPWPAQPGWTPDSKRLRLLVPGRIKGGKGEDLLAEIIPRLPADVELVLLGAGAAGMRFFGARGVHVLLDYARDELPLRIAALRPRAALLLSTVAETFSYALSEMQSLGVPVIATRRGSFAERIQHGVDGLLVEPDADAVLACIDELRNGRLQAPPPRFDAGAASLQAMCGRYAEALALRPAVAGQRAQRGLLSEVQRDAGMLQERLLEAQLARLGEQLDAVRDESARRGHWAREQSQLAQDRLAWAQQLDQELERTRDDWAQANKERDMAIEERDAAQRERDESQQARDLAADQARSLDEALQARERDLERQRSESSQLLEERERWIAALTQQRDEFERERNAILASTSWKLTAPLRVGRRLLSRLFSRARFQASRALSLQARGLRSLKMRGLGGTLRRLRQEFTPPPQAVAQALHLPESADALSLDGIAFAAVEAPLASIVIPAYNHLDHTLTCLRSLCEQGARVAFEVIVVDDCGSDQSAELLPRIPGLVFHRNARNLGFIGACNAGAARARGDFLIFLNNDTAVQPGWLDALLDTFAQHDRVGLVGAKLVYPDGRLQEAGGIVFADGSGWNYGRFDDPADPKYNFVREADYCSGAAIALRRPLFEQFGGFDALYAPAYYEDTDLAMKVRAAGLRVLYQPKSVVVHFEGISSGTDTSSGTKRFQVINQGKFLERWNDVLGTHAPAGTDIAIARQHRCRHRVLVIDATTPQPDQDSGSVRLVNLLRLLRDEGAAVTFFADNRAWVERYTGDLQQLGIEVLWHPFLSDPVGWIEKEARRFDTIIVSRHYILCNYLDLFRQHAPAARLVFDTVDLHYLREQRAAELADRDDLRRTAEQTRQKELDLIRRVDVTLVVSPVEQELLAREAPGARVDVLSNVHEVVGCRRPFAARRDLLFVGGFQHPPNIDAVEWFVAEVLPRVLAAEPELLFHIIGSKAPDSLQALNQQPGVRFHGYVADIEPYLDGCRLAVAPLRYGAGVKGKVNMSMAYGQPVVATPIAVEGMYLRAGEDVLVGADPAAFAEAVLRAYRDEALWHRLSENGMANVEQHFSFAAARRAVQALLDR